MADLSSAPVEMEWRKFLQDRPEEKAEVKRLVEATRCGRHRWVNVLKGAGVRVCMHTHDLSCMCTYG